MNTASKQRQRSTVTLCITMAPETRREVEKECERREMTASAYFRLLHKEATAGKSQKY